MALGAGAWGPQDDTSAIDADHSPGEVRRQVSGHHAGYGPDFPGRRPAPSELVHRPGKYARARPVTHLGQLGRGCL